MVPAAQFSYARTGMAGGNARRKGIFAWHVPCFIRGEEQTMKSLILTLALLLALPAVGAAGPAWPGLYAASDNRGRSPSGTVVITGRDGRVTGVERNPDGRGGNGERERNQERERDRNRESSPGGPGGPGGRRN